MPFGVLSGVGRGMGVLDRGGDRRKEGAVFGLNVGHSIVAQLFFFMRGGDAALPKLLWDFLFTLH